MTTQIHTKVLTAGPGYKGTSATSLTLAGSGSVTLTADAGLAYEPTSRVRLGNDSTHYMEGTVTAYNYVTGAMTVLLDFSVGSGAFSAWSLSIVGRPGIISLAGASGNIQYNSGSGTLAASSNFSWNSSTGVLAISDGANRNIFLNGGGSISSGTDNVGIGVGALAACTSGGNNVAIGTNAGLGLTTGNYNTLCGVGAGQGLTTAIETCAFGLGALQNCTTGVQNCTIGMQNLNGLTTGGFNTCCGTGCMELCVTGNNNVAVGNHALHGVMGNRNIGIGFYGGFYATGSDEFYVGNVDQASNANEKAFDLIYATFAGAAGSLTGQVLTVNGNFIANSGSGGGSAGGCLGLYTNSANAAARHWGMTSSFVAFGDMVICQGASLGATPFAGAGNIRMFWNASGLAHILNVPVYANNAAAVTGGLAVGGLYRTGANPDPVCIVH